MTFEYMLNIYSPLFTRKLIAIIEKQKMLLNA